MATNLTPGKHHLSSRGFLPSSAEKYGNAKGLKLHLLNDLGVWTTGVSDTQKP